MEQEGDVQVAPGRENDSIIVHKGDGYYYHVREVRGLRARLKCRHRGLGCRGTASVNLRTGILRSLQRHTCRRDPLLLADHQMRRDMVTEARTNVLGAGVRQILRDFRIRCQDAELASRFTPARMHSALYEARASNYPRLPNSLSHLGVLLGMPQMQAICQTVDGNDFIFAGVAGAIGNKTVALIFASGRMLHFLQSRSNLHFDGTFKKRPKKPKCIQIFNIVTNYNDTVIAVARILMMRRTEEAYDAVFDRLRTLSPNMNPTRVHCDFERGLMNSLRRAFPGCPIAGCLWHYAVACSSQARTLGLRPLALEREIVLGFIRCLCAAPLLPEDLIGPGVNEILREVNASGWGPNLGPLFAYFRREWLPRKSELSVFNHPERTNNQSESDNHMLANVLPQNRPNAWRLIGGFVQAEHLSYSDKLAIDAGRTVNGARRWRAIANDNAVRRMVNLLIRDEITPGGFLHGVSYTIQAGVLHGLRMANHDRDSESDSDSDSGSDSD